MIQASPVTKVLLAACAVALCATAGSSAFAAGGRQTRPVSASATVLVPVSVSVAQNLSSGAVKTHGSAASGQVVVPASYPTLASPAPTYVNADAQNGANGQAPNAAQVNLTGSPGQAFTLTFQSWSEISGVAGSTAAASSFYSPGNSPTNVAQGVFNTQGQATIYIGATITVQRSNSATTVVLKPNFTVTYN